MSNTKNSTVRSLVAFAISAVLLVVAGLVLMNRQYIADQISVWNYQPGEAVASIATKAEMTKRGTFVFYATTPSIEKDASFNAKCPRKEQASPIVGCYTTDDRIFIYDITNQQLDGIEEVTAVHELLHAVWARTSKADREKLTKELTTAYEKLENDELKTRMEYYKRTEAGEFANELHSILGTEVSALGETLETYYAQYFNRQTTLRLHEQYRSVYRKLYDRSQQLVKDMETLANSITARSASYDAAAKQYLADRDSFNRRANENQFATQAQFDNERISLINRLNQLNIERERLNADIARYNEYNAELQEIAKQVEVLNKSVDSFSEIRETPSL